jgi:hypothetical protein
MIFSRTGLTYSHTGLIYSQTGLIYSQTCRCPCLYCHINLPIHPPMPVLSYKLAHLSTHACIVTMFAFCVCRIVCIYYLINLFGDLLSQSSSEQNRHSSTRQYEYFNFRKRFSYQFRNWVGHF